MKYNNWTPVLGDYITTEDAYSKKHQQLVIREKINKIILLISLSSICTTVFIYSLYVISNF